MPLRLCCLLLFTALFLTPASAAFAGNPDHVVNIQIDPALTAIEKRYKEEAEQLTPQQRKILENLDIQSTQSHEPALALDLANGKFKSCSLRDPQLNSHYGKMLENFKFAQLDILKENQRLLFAAQRKINFIDPKSLSAHLEFDRRMQKALMNGVAQIQFQMIADGKADDQCAKLKAELAPYKNPYVVAAQYPPPKSFSHRDKNGQIMSCTISFGHNIPSLSSQISTAVVFIKGRNQAVDFEYSTKIFSGQNSFHTIEDTWLEFGNINTGFKGGHSKPGNQIMIGSLPAKYIVPALYFMKTQPVISGAKATGWPQTVAFASPVLAAKEAENLASCIAALDPTLTPYLKKTGFQITADSRHKAAPSSQTSEAEQMALYATNQVLQSGDSSGACMWFLGPSNNGDTTITGVLTTTGFVRPTHKRNHSFIFQFAGMRDKETEQSRITFANASLTTKNPETGAVINTKRFQTASTPGQRYEIQLPLSQLDIFLKSIRANGFTFKLHEDKTGKIFQQTFPPPDQKAYQDYANCVGKILPDVQLTP